MFYIIHLSVRHSVVTEPKQGRWEGWVWSTPSPWRTVMKTAMFNSIMAVSCKFCWSSLLSEGNQLSKSSPIYGFMSVFLYTSSVCELSRASAFTFHKKMPNKLRFSNLTKVPFKPGPDSLRCLNLPLVSFSPATLKWWALQHFLNSYILWALSYYVNIFLRTHSALWMLRTWLSWCWVSTQVWCFLAESFEIQMVVIKALSLLKLYCFTNRMKIHFKNQNFLLIF